MHTKGYATYKLYAALLLLMKNKEIVLNHSSKRMPIACRTHRIQLERGRKSRGGLRKELSVNSERPLLRLTITQSL